MIYCRDYYDANEVAQESYNELYTWKDQPTLCDCGNVAEHGQVYCESCKANMRTAFELAIDFLERYNGVDREMATSQLVYEIEEE